MILKVTKSAKTCLCEHSTMMMMMVMSLSLSPLSSVFFCFDVSPHFSPLNGFERSKMVHGGLCTVCMMVHGGLLFTVYVSDGLESSQFCSYTHDGLEMSQFTMCTSPKWS